jgi:hypothetical protein
MNNGDGLDPKNLDDLITRLSHCQKAASGDRIPVRDVQEILQQAGLLESLLEERPSSIEGASKMIEPQSSRRKFPFKKRFFALAVTAIGFSGIVGYNIGADYATRNTKLYANLTDVRRDTSDTGLTKAGDTMGSTRDYLPYFSLIYQGCKRSGTAVKCSVDVVARITGDYMMGECTTNDKEPYHVKLFDSKGSVYKADLIEFGKGRVDETGEIICSITRLHQKVPVKATITFKNVDPKIKIIRALEIYIAHPGNDTGYKWNNPQFRQVAIE